jgi:hypothetical protein
MCVVNWFEAFISDKLEGKSSIAPFQCPESITSESPTGKFPTNSSAAQQKRPPQPPLASASAESRA